ncbi:MAG: stalk domain-containing protein, partial [Dehalococcoidales bacterium]
MVKRLVCTFLVVCVMLAPMTALSNDFTMGYPVGDTTYKLEGKYCVEAANAVVSGNNINFSPGGSVKYDFLLPFNIRSVTVSYEGNSSAALLINTGSSQYSVKLMRAKGKELLNFGEHLGYAPMEYSYTGRTTEKEFVERAGERLFTVSASGAVRITGIEFEKERVPVPTNPFALPDLSANERAIEAAVILDRDASMIMVNGGRRYINIDDPQETPLVFDGRIYLPIEILARALGYYYESIPEKNYALLRKEPYEFVFLNGKCTLQRNAAEPEEIENLLHYRDDRAFLPVRYFAEALGKTVVYKDGIAAIDNKFSAADILNNYSVFNYVKNRFSDFHPQKAVGNTYYVAQTPNADDSNNGSIFAPFRTLA